MESEQKITGKTNSKCKNDFMFIVLVNCFIIITKILLLPCTWSIAGSLSTVPLEIRLTMMEALQMMVVLLYCVNAVAVSVLFFVVSLTSIIDISLNPLSTTICSAASVPLTKNITLSALAMHWNTTLSPFITLADSGDTSISVTCKREEIIP